MTRPSSHRPIAPSTAYIALGSNLGDGRALIAAALRDLEARAGIDVLAASPLLETDAEGPVPQPPFINGAAVLGTSLGPRELLGVMQAVETAHGRDRATEGRFGPRTLDLDLLLFDELVIDGPDLVVPHPRMHLRAFVLAPLARIAPDAVHPVLDQTVRSLYHRQLQERAT